MLNSPWEGITRDYCQVLSIMISGTSYDISWVQEYLISFQIKAMMDYLYQKIRKVKNLNEIYVSHITFNN